MLTMKSTVSLRRDLAILATEAARLGMSDTRWATASGIRKETLSRLWSRKDCDLATLRALAAAVGAHVVVLPADRASEGVDRHMPDQLTRQSEERLLELVASGSLDAAAWRREGPAFFMAGIAVMLASGSGVDRASLLELAERLHPGASTTEVFALWLRRSPLRPSRFLAMLTKLARHEG